jgi:hypothetical protein
MTEQAVLAPHALETPAIHRFRQAESKTPDRGLISQDDCEG